MLLTSMMLVTACDKKEDFKVTESIKENEEIKEDGIYDVQVNQLSSFLSEAIQTLHFHGLSNEEIIEDFGSLDNPAIIVAALYADESYLYGVAMVSNPDNSEPDLFDCLMRSIGIDAAVEIVNGKLKGAALRKAVRKIATRTLGWAGAAWAVYEFGDCMGWYGANPGNSDIFSRNMEMYDAAKLYLGL